MRLCNSTLPDSHRSVGMSHAPIALRVTNLERAVRFELTIPDLQSGALGRLATRARLERKERIELSNRVWKTRMFPTTSLPQVVGEDRIELSPRVPKTRMLALHHTPKFWRD